ncbi:MAG: FAD-dependent oxidoreductase [Gammaproteobacteria bacterium]|nr:FAD-dependent oxidoreductase [Gammaproteobacteria bacterium]
MNEQVSRRRFLGLVGAAGGATAVYQASRAMGLLPDTGKPALLQLARAPKSGNKVVILGAGLTGLTIAYELERAGYDCTIVEASHRVGGRILTLRHGDKIDEMGYDSVCRFDDEPHLYFNCGAARIAGHHHRVLHYCRELGVPLEIMANDNAEAYTHDPDAFGGRPVRIREFRTDARGFLSELLYKAVDRNEFDKPLSEQDRLNMLEFARAYGELNEEARYKGSKRAGFGQGTDGFASLGLLKDPMDLSELLNSSFWRHSMHFNEDENWAAPLMTPTGGMDKIPQAFAREIQSPITLNAQVQAIRLRDSGVEVAYNHRGKRHQIRADYCFNNIPAHFVAGIDNNFPETYAKTIAGMYRNNFGKIGLQMKSRFWERENIYGGITFTRQRINQIWYPSHGIHRQKGVVLGCYAFGRDQTAFFERMTPQERIRFAGAAGDKIHNGYSEQIDTGVSVMWGRMKHMMGCGSTFRSPEEWEKLFPIVQNPQGRHYMVGDQVSYHPTWQEGAFSSAEFALQHLDQRVRAAARA